MNFNDPCTSPQGLLTLLSLDGIGGTEAVRLVQKFRTLEDLFLAEPAMIRQILPVKIQDKVLDPANQQAAYVKAEEIREQAEQLGVKLITFLSDEYPPLLCQISDFPPLLYVKGQLKLDNQKVACVGTRQPTYFGAEVDRRMVRVLAASGWGVVSGLAVGIDTIAHRAALAVHGYTVAVLGNGLDKIYPQENSRLAQDILEAGGALISEQPFQTQAIPRHLIQRNRIQTGLSVATLLLQTNLTGGTMHAVRFAVQQGRRLYVPVPPPGRFAREEKSQGVLTLAGKPGSELVSILNASSNFAAILKKEFANAPVARAITGRVDYPQLVRELSELAGLNIEFPRYPED